MGAMTERTYFADNARTLMVLSIVALHSFCAYAAIIPWWHVRDDLSPFADIAILLIDPFALPVLFFLAGAFAPISLAAHGRKGFVLGKCMRLGVPLVVLTALYLPSMVYVGCCRKVPDPAGYPEFLLNWFTTAGDWSVYAFTSMESAAAHQFDSSPHHLWFVTMLLFFMAVYALFGGIGRTDSSRSPIMILLAGGVCMAAGEAGINMLIQDWAWIKCGPFILFQATRVPIYAGCFIFGTVFSRNGRFRDALFPGPIWVWGVVWAAFEFGILVSGKMLMASPGPLPLVPASACGLLRSFAALSACMFFLKLAARFGNTRTAVGAGLAAASYDIYLLHMPLMVFIQKFFTAYGMNPLLKAACVFVTATAVCWAVSRWVVRRSKYAWAVLLSGYAVVWLMW